MHSIQKAAIDREGYIRLYCVKIFSFVPIHFIVVHRVIF